MHVCDQSKYTRVGLLVPRCNCGSSKPEAEWGADLKFEFEFKKKPQSVDRTKRPRSCVGSEPGEALKGASCRLRSVASRGWWVGTKKQPRSHKCSARGDESAVKSIE